MNIKPNNNLSWSRRWLPVLLAGFVAQAMAGSRQLGSVLDPSQGPPSSAGGDSWASVISPDGRYVLFASTANNLVLASNGLPLPVLVPPRANVFLRDRTNLTTTLVSVNLAGTGGGNGDSFPVGLSTNGQYALFESSSSDLVAGDTNNAPDVFRRDLLAGTTVLVSVGTNGAPGNGASRGAMMTPDGRFVAFASEASNLSPNDTNGIADVFVRDLQAGTTALVSEGARSNLDPTMGGSESPVITPDGRYVAFYSGATNLVAGLTNSGDIYVRDLVARTTAWASTYARAAMQAASGVSNAISCSQAISDDGQWVAFQANPAFATLQATGPGVVLRYNVANATTDVIHPNALFQAGAPENLRTLAMSPDGRFVAFLARTNGVYYVSDNCVLVWDGKAGTTTLASGDSNNSVPTNSRCAWPAITPGGQFVAFLSSATNLVASGPTNGYHVYVRDLQAGTTTLVDASSNGVSSIAGPATVPQMTPDGRFVTFESPDANLLADDRNRGGDVFVRDLAAGATELISARDPALPTATPNGSSQPWSLSLSADGRYLAFSSDADNLVPADTNGYRDVFTRDLTLGTNLLVSVATNGVAGDGQSGEPAISADGRYVAFSSGADNLVAGDTNKAQDVFVRDLQAGTTALVSVNLSGANSGNAASYSPTLSSDGRFVLFRSKATDLAAGSFTTGYENLFLRDLLAATNCALTHNSSSSVTPAAMTPDGHFVAFCGPLSFSLSGTFVWDCWSAAFVYTNPLSIGNLGISADGQRIAYTSYGTLSADDRVSRVRWTIGPVASTTHPGLRFSGDGRFLAYVAGVNNTNQVYLYDLQYSTNLLVSQSYNSAAPAAGNSDWPEVSSDGRFVAFRSPAPDLVSGDTNGLPDVFLYDRLNNTTTLVSVNRFGTAAGDNRSLAPAFSANAQTLVFQSWASDLVPQDFNHSGDVFVCQLYASGEIPVFSTTIIGDSQGPWLIWPVVSGRSYRVQYKNSLTDSTWQDLNGNISILGNQGYLHDSAGSSPRFYRVVAF